MKKRKMAPKTLTEFKNHLKNLEKSKATREKYLRDTDKLMKFAQGQEITKELLLSYKYDLKKNYAVSSANSMIAAINTFLSFAGWEDLKIKPFKTQKKVYCPEEKELTKAEYLRLVQAANERLSLLIQAVCSTGIRISELQFITLEAARKGEASVSCKGKNRTVFIVPALRRKLLQYAQKSKITTGPLFITKSGSPINRSNVWKEMKRLCKKAKVSPAKVFPHNLRHLFARIFYSIEKDLAKLADILGHSDVNTTRIYIMTTGVEHRKRMEKMHLIL